MRLAEQIQIVFVSLIAALAWIRPLSRRSQLRVYSLTIVMIFIVCAGRFSAYALGPTHSTTFRDWLPAVLFLVPYWQVGNFFKGANAIVQERLAAFDGRFFEMIVPEHRSSRWSSAWSLYMEVVYLLVYPLIPLGLGVLYSAGLRHQADYYWAVVLSSSYLCFGITPFVPALPPRMVNRSQTFHAPSTRLRSLNHWILQRASIQAITFPSAHVAAAVAEAMVLLHFVPLAGLAFGWLALSIMVAAIVGGYHYVADVLLAFVIAVVIFSAFNGSITIRT
jgi:PAP2 superfamily